jgi:multidrug resistance efflux pump
MFTKYVLPMLAVAGLVGSVYSVIQAQQVPPPSKPIVEPPTRPDRAMMIAGSGLVEARRENIPIGVNIPGVVTQIYVKKGEKVKSGAPLFRIDDRDLKSQLEVRLAELSASKARLHKLENAPRPEDIPPARATVEEAEARMNDAEAAMARTQRLFARAAIPASDFDKDRYAFLAAKATYAKAKAELELIMAGTWKEDLEVARAEVQLARSQVDSINISLDRLIVRAPMDGEVLQLNVRLGQFAVGAWKEPMIVLGDIHRLHVRVDIDENDLPYFSTTSEAIATLKGRPRVRFPLKFVYVEPYVIPKQSLTGYNSERVDTRVLQVIYELPVERAVEVYVGQQMDVYLRAVPGTEGGELEVGGLDRHPLFEGKANEPAAVKPSA